MEQIFQYRVHRLRYRVMSGGIYGEDRNVANLLQKDDVAILLSY